MATTTDLVVETVTVSVISAEGDTANRMMKTDTGLLTADARYRLRSVYDAGIAVYVTRISAAPQKKKIHLYGHKTGCI